MKISITALLVIAGLLIFISCEEIKNIEPEQIEQDSTKEVSKLVVTDLKETKEEITGVVENTTDSTIDFLTADITYYADNVIVGQDAEYVDDFKAGQKWKFTFYNMIEYDRFEIEVREEF